MSLQKSFALLVFAVALCFAQEQKYCGRSLARALAALCFETSNADKRADGTMYNSILSPYYHDQEPQYGWAWGAHKARSLGSFASRGKRLIVNECCDKACTIEELLSYCNY